MRELVATTAAGSEGWLSLSSSAGWIAVLVCSWPTARPCNQSHHHINGVLLLFTVTTRPLLTSPTWTPTELFIPARRLGQLWSAPTLLVSFGAIESLFERLDFVQLAKQTITVHYLFVARATAADIWGLLLFFHGTALTSVCVCFPIDSGGQRGVVFDAAGLGDPRICWECFSRACRWSVTWAWIVIGEDSGE